MERLSIDRIVIPRSELSLSSSPNAKNLNYRAAERSKVNYNRLNETESHSLTNLNVKAEQKSKKNSKLLLLQELESRLNIELTRGVLPSLIEKILKNSSGHIECSLQDLKHAEEDIRRIIKNFENFKVAQGVFHLGLSEFEVIVNNLDTIIAKKEDVQSVFLNSLSEVKCHTIDDILVPEAFLGNFHEIMTGMQSAYECKKIVIPNSLSKEPQNKYISEIQHSAFLQAKSSHQSLIYELEWQKEEFKLLKTQLKSKKHELALKDSDLNLRYKNLKKHRISMAHEFEKLEKKIEEFEKKKKVFFNISEKISAMIEDLSITSESPEKGSFPETQSDFLCIKDEIFSLEEELKSLEIAFRHANADKAGSLHTQIYHVKTKISSLKSINLLKNTQQNAKSAKNIMQNFNKVYSLRTPYPHKTTGGFRSNRSSPYNSTVQFDFNKLERTSLNSVPSKDKFGRSTSVTITDMLDHEFDRKEYLTQKEVRLSEKEEELDRKEENFIKKLEKTGNIEDATLLKEELRSISRSKRYFETKQKQLEMQWNDQEKSQKLLKLREIELEKRQLEIFDSQERLQDERQTLLIALENLKNCIEENISKL